MIKLNYDKIFFCSVSIFFCASRTNKNIIKMLKILVCLHNHFFVCILSAELKREEMFYFKKMQNKIELHSPHLIWSRACAGRYNNFFSFYVFIILVLTIVCIEYLYSFSYLHCMHTNSFIYLFELSLSHTHAHTMGDMNICNDFVIFL